MVINKRRIIGIIGILILIGAMLGLAYLKEVSDYQKAVAEITIDDIDISKIPDGSYYGSYDVGFIYAEVKIDIENHKITDVELVEHKNERGSSAEVITERIVAEQRLNVDAVSGATNSSKVIKMACVNALSGVE